MATQPAKTISLVRSSANTASKELDEFRKAFARNLTQALSAKNIVPAGEGDKKERLAAMLGAPAPLVGSWLTGQSLPDAWYLAKLSEIVNVPTDVLLNRVPQPLDAPLIDEEYHRITIHDETTEDGYNLFTLPETLRHMNLPRSTAMMSVSNDDMAPMFRPGDIAIYDPRVNSISTNGIFILRAQGASYIRRVHKSGRSEIKLLCDNAAIPAVVMTPDDFTKNPESELRTYVVGRVLGRINIGSF